MKKFSCRHFQPVTAAVGLWKGKKEEGEGKKGRLLPTQSTQQFTGAGCNFSAWFLPEVFKCSYHEQRPEFACKLGKAGINKPNAECHEQSCVAAACYSNILSQFPLRAVGFCHSCCSASITEVTAARKTFSLPWPFISYLDLPLAGTCIQEAAA